MTTAPLVLPRLAQLASERWTPTVLVGATRGQVLHLAPADRLTPTGRLPRFVRPLCGTYGRTWRSVQIGTQPLCGHCAKRAGDLIRREDWQQLRPDDVLLAMNHSRSAGDVDDALRAWREADLRYATVPRRSGGRIPVLRAMQRHRAWRNYTS